MLLLEHLEQDMGTVRYSEMVIIPFFLISKGFFIPKGYYSEVFFFSFGKVINSKIFMPKGHYSEDFLTRRVIVLNFRITTLRNKNFS